MDEQLYGNNGEEVLDIAAEEARAEAIMSIERDADSILSLTEEYQL